MYIVSGVSSRAGGPEVTLEAELSIHNDAGCHKGMKLRRKKPKGPGAKSLLPECRIMALTSLPLSQVVDDEDAGRHYVAAGCSDGIVRQYIYNEETCSFSPQETLQFHNRCILTLNHIVFTSELSTCQRVRTLCVLSAATDGNVAVWNVSKALLAPNASGVEHCRGEVNGSTRPLAVCQAHQSGINDMAIQQVKEGVYYLSTVGDDNALAVLILTLPAANSPHTTCLKVLCTEHNAHASSITGVSFLSPSVVVTTSVDQRLSVWRMRESGNTDTAGALTTLGSSQQAVRLDHVYSHTHDVADVSSLSLYHWGQDRAVVVICGIGVQSFIIGK
jgi:WD40 repeat protein